LLIIFLSKTYGTLFSHDTRGSAFKVAPNVIASAYHGVIGDSSTGVPPLPLIFSTSDMTPSKEVALPTATHIDQVFVTSMSL
jgi:hypothetical protein